MTSMAETLKDIPCAVCEKVIASESDAKHCRVCRITICSKESCVHQHQKLCSQFGDGYSKPSLRSASEGKAEVIHKMTHAKAADKDFMKEQQLDTRVKARTAQAEKDREVAARRRSLGTTSPPRARREPPPDSHDQPGPRARLTSPPRARREPPADSHDQPGPRARPTSPSRARPPAASSCCTYCGAEKKSSAQKLYFCNRCKRVPYCNAICQANDWDRHRNDCGGGGAKKRKHEK